MVECVSITIISINYLPVSENKYYSKVQLENYAYIIGNTEMVDYLDDNLFEMKILKLSDFGKWVLLMLHFNRSDLSKGIAAAKYNNSKECIVCHYWFSNHDSKLQNCAYNGCHDLTILCLNIGNIAITLFLIIFVFLWHDINKSEAIHLLENSVLDDCRYIENAYQFWELNLQPFWWFNKTRKDRN